MAGKHSYIITLSNNNTEKEAIEFLLKKNPQFIYPDKDSRKTLIKNLGIDSRYSRAFDLIIIPGHSNIETQIQIENNKEIILVELKTTKKKLLNNPHGFFFGATENEFDLARILGNQFRFCFVSLHPESEGFSLLTLKEVEELIVTKRTQFQINLKNYISL